MEKLEVLEGLDPENMVDEDENADNISSGRRLKLLYKKRRSGREGA
jgi:hypothetical protein